MQRGAMAPSRLAVALLPLLAGCTLIDQRTFNPHAGERATVPAPPGPAPVPPLVVIDFGKPNTDYDTALRRPWSRPSAASRTCSSTW